MNEDQRQQLVDLIDKLESEGLSKKEIQSQVDIKKQDFNTENNLGKTLPSQPEEVAIVEENVATNMDSNLENGSSELFADNTKNQSIQELKNLVDELSAQGLSNLEIQIRVDKEKEKRVNAQLVKENKKQTSIQAIDNKLNSTKKEEDEEIKYESAPQYIYENIVDFVGDIGNAWNNGMLQGEQTDRGIELAGFFGDPANEEELDAFVNGQKEVAQKTIQSAEMREFDKIFEEAGGGMWGFLKGAAYNPSLLTTMLTSSVASQLSSIKNSEEVAMAATAGALAGSLAGPLGTVVGITTGSMAMMEAGLTFNELLMEEIGGDINDPKVKDKIRAVLNDPEKMSDLRRKAGMRGAVIAGVELATLGIAKGVAGRLAGKVGLLAGGATEIVGGGLGEVAGRAVAGQEMDAKEIGFEAFAGLGSAPLSLGSAALNLQTAIQTSEIGKTVRDSDYKSISDVYSDKNSNSTTAIDISKKSKSTKIVDREVNEKVKSGKLTKEEGDTIKNNFRATQGAVNQVKDLNFNTEQETKSVELLKEKNKLENQIKKVSDTALTKPEQERVDAIDKELGDLRVDRAAQTIVEAIDSSKIIVVENAKELENKYKIKDVKNKKYSASGGFFEGGKLYINKEIAGKFKTITEPSHELLHPILQEALKANPQQLVDEFKKVIGKDNAAAVDARIASIDIYTDKYMEANPDEFITQFGDMILEEQITYNDNIFTKLGDYITPLLRKFGFKKIKFNTGKDVYNFMREYSRNIKEGKLSEDVKAVIPTELTTNEATFSVKKASVLEDINKLVPQNITTKAEFETFKSDPRAFPKLYNAINNQGGVINNYIRSISTSKAETEKTIENLTNRILKFNPEAKRADGTAVGIEAFGERVFADVQFAKLGSKKELFQESEKTKSESRIEDREDGFEAAAETEVESAPAAPAQGRKLVRDILNNEGKQELKDAVANLNLTEEQLNFKKLPNAAIEVFAKAIGIPAKKFDGKANFTRDELDKVINFIEENIDIIRQALPEAAIAEGSPVSENLIGTATGVPTNLLKDSNLYTRQDRGTRLSGLIAYIKNKGIDNSSILKAIGNVDGRRMASPRDKAAQTAKGLITMLAKFATNQEVRLQKNLTAQQATNIEVGKGSKVLFSVKDKNNFNKIFKNAPEEVLKYGMLLNVKPTQKAINKVLYTIEEDLAPDAYEEYYKKYFEPYIKFRKFAQKQKWPWAEEKVRDTLTFLSENNPNLRLKNIELNKDSQKVDIEFEFDGKKVLVEVKKNYEARISQIYLYEEADGKISTNKTADKIYEDKIAKADKTRNVLIDRINRDYKKYPIERNIVNGRVQYIVPIFAINGARESLKKDKIAYETTIEMPIDLAVSLYTTKANKEKNVKGLLISFGDLGTFYIGENKMQFPVPSLEQEGVELTVRMMDKYNPRTAPVMFDGKPIKMASLSRIAVNTLTPKAVKVLENTPSLSLQNESQAAAIFNTAYSIKKATEKNNNKLPASQKLPKDSTNEQVLAKMRELDNQANEARAAFSVKQNLDDDFNKIIEAKTGIETYQRFDRAGATVKGASKGRFNFFIPPSAEDFVGLLYKTLGKGKVGDRQLEWFKDNLINPYARAMNNVSSARVAMFEDYKTLKEDLKIIPKDLKKKGVEEYTREQAVRVYIWDQQGNKIPGIFKTNQQKLVDYVAKNPDLKVFADQLIAMQKGDQYSSPNEGWLAGSITTDLLDSVNSIKRKKYLEQWQTNVDEIFGETNMNKLEAAFGKPYREALTNILTRMKTGRNKAFSSDSLAGRFTNWLNNSVGAIMFFNTRSAVLQLLSSVNFVNFTDNNPLKAGAAFANQPQYWKDFKFLFNSDFLKERRGGLRFNVSESEIADAAQKGGAKGVISKILQAGFLPTQMADSFAIATGGATFYRNRVKTYLKQGLTEAEANEKAFVDFRETAEESQQSSRPDRISSQQAGPLGRTILAFANTPAQYARLTKKAASDIINGRGDLKTNLSKLAYYGAVQNLIFNFLQQAVFALAFGDDDEENEKKKQEKYLGVANGMADGFLRGIGVAGAITATLKNALIKIIKESEKARPDYAETAIVQLLGISPPVQSKTQKIRSALKSYEWNKDEMKEKGFSLDNPAYLAAANVISAGFNVPLDRIVKKVDNIKNSTQDEVSMLNRIMLLAGWSDWQLGIKKEKPKKSKDSRVKVRKSSSRTGKRKVTIR